MGGSTEHPQSEAPPPPPISVPSPCLRASVVKFRFPIPPSLGAQRRDRIGAGGREGGGEAEDMVYYLKNSNGPREEQPMSMTERRRRGRKPWVPRDERMVPKN